MSNFLKTAVLAALEEHQVQKQFFFDDYPTNADEKSFKYFDEEIKQPLQTLYNQGVSAETADSYGGEGQGEEYWSVIKFTKGSEVVYFKFEGSYYSYDGANYDDFYQVEPKTVEVVKYFRLK